MANSLTPTTVTDKNGRITTVHKRLDARQSAAKLSKVPAPALPSSVTHSAPSATPLAAPTPLSESETQEFNDWYGQIMKSVKYNNRAIRAFTRNTDAPAKALALKLTQGETVYPNAVLNLLNVYHDKVSPLFKRDISDDDAVKARHDLYTSLRVADKMAQTDALAVKEYGFRLAATILRVMNGYDRNRPTTTGGVTPIDTEEELASLSAVATFIMFATDGFPEMHKEGSYRDSDHQLVRGTWITNKTLDAFLRENPNEVHRVMDYLNERGPLGNGVREAKAMIKHLEESSELGALDQGWL